MTTGILLIATLGTILIGAIAAFYLLRHNTVFPISLQSLNTEDLNHGITYETELQGSAGYFRYHEKRRDRYNNETPPQLRLWLACPINGDFRITRENRGDIAAKKMGLSKEIQTGDQAFDELVYIHTHSQVLMENFLFDPGNRAMITSLFENGFTELSLNGSELAAQSKPFSTGNFSDSQFIPDNLGRLLKLSRKLATSSPGRDSGGLPIWKTLRLLLILLAWLVLIAGLSLMLYGMNTFIPLDSWDLFKFTLPFAGVASFIYLSLSLLLLKGRSAAHRDLGHIGIISLLGFPCLTFGLAILGNSQLDRSTSVEHNMPLLYKNIRHSKNSTTYYATVKSWRPTQETESLQIDDTVYQMLEPKRDRFIITTRKGYLDYEWLVGIAPLISNDAPDAAHSSRVNSGLGQYLDQ